MLDLLMFDDLFTHLSNPLLSGLGLLPQTQRLLLLHAHASFITSLGERGTINSARKAQEGFFSLGKQIYDLSSIVT